MPPSSISRAVSIGLVCGGLFAGVLGSDGAPAQEAPQDATASEASPVALTPEPTTTVAPAAGSATPAARRAPAKGAAGPPADPVPGAATDETPTSTPTGAPTPAGPRTTATPDSASSGKRPRGRRVAELALFDEGTPVWFRPTVDLATRRVLREQMSANGHFMSARYRAFDRPLRIPLPDARDER